MYVSSINSRVFHTADCRYAEKIGTENGMIHHSFDAAKRTGRRACKCCNRVATLYRHDKKEIENYAAGKNIRLEMRNSELLIDSVLSPWKVVELTGGRITLLHGNNEDHSKLIRLDDGRVAYNYHHQTSADYCTTIPQVLEYIVSHDDWKLEHATPSRSPFADQTRRSNHAGGSTCHRRKGSRREKPYSRAFAISTVRMKSMQTEQEEYLMEAM